MDVEQPDTEIEDCNGDSTCPLCKGPLGHLFWPHVRVPFTDGTVKLCHLHCVRQLAAGNPVLDGPEGDGLEIEEAFMQDLLGVIKYSPQLDYRNPLLRLCYEEQNLEAIAASGKRPSWPPVSLPPPPPAAFAFEGLIELRISGCSALKVLPPEIGRFHGVKNLVLISNGLVQLPEEIAGMSILQQLFVNGNFLRSVPDAVGKMPSLREVTVDANLLEVLPDFASPNLKLLTASGNKLKELPSVAGRMERLEIHGNWISSLSGLVSSQLRPRWDYMICLKVMGNRLRTLPPELSKMYWLRMLMVSNNQLEVLPEAVARFRWLEWCFAYENQLQDLPAGLLTGSRYLERVLLEGNPLEASCVERLLSSMQKSTATTVGLDISQVAAVTTALPPAVAVGRLLHVDGEGQYTLKLIRASQIRREPGVLAAGQPGCPPTPDDAPAKLLIVALAASQGEPEWMGLLRRLFEQKTVQRFPSPPTSLTEALKAVDNSDPEASMAELWMGCRRQPPMDLQEPLPLGDFDVLSGIDHRMRWYSEDAPALSSALQKVCAPYQRVLFVGASMGGFGSLRHGGRLADAVLAFSPQASLSGAALRPPAESVEALNSLAEQLFESINLASSRGALVNLHCAADDHLLHAMTMPSALELTVHPLLPRKPFARLLDRAGLLLCIVADTVARLLQAPPRLPDDPRGGLEVNNGTTKVACWRAAGSLLRFSADVVDLAGLFFGPGAPPMPRPGDWFCQRCTKRNMSSSFFCYNCGIEEEGTAVCSAGAAVIPGGHNYPRVGDWGCGACGQAQCSYQDTCSRCGSAKVGGHEHTVIVS